MCPASKPSSQRPSQESAKATPQLRKSNVGWALGPVPPPQPSPRGENKLGDVLVGGTPPLHGQLHHQGFQRLLALLPPRSCWDGSHGLGCAMVPAPCLAAQLWDGQGFAKAPLTPMCCPLAFSPSCRVQPTRPRPPAAPSPPCSGCPAPPSAQELLFLHPQSTWRGVGWLKLTFCGTGGGEQGQHEGREEQPHPGCPGAQPSCDCAGWSRAEPQHPLFAQPAPAGESKQPKVRTGEKGQR